MAPRILKPPPVPRPRRKSGSTKTVIVKDSYRPEHLGQSNAPQRASQINGQRVGQKWRSQTFTVVSRVPLTHPIQQVSDTERLFCRRSPSRPGKRSPNAEPFRNQPFCSRHTLEGWKPTTGQVLVDRRNHRVVTRLVAWPLTPGPIVLHRIHTRSTFRRLIPCYRLVLSSPTGQLHAAFRRQFCLPKNELGCPFGEVGRVPVLGQQTPHVAA